MPYFFALLFISLAAFTPSSIAMPLERPTIIDDSNNTVVLWVQQDSFNENMDVLGYSNNFAPKAAKLDFYMVQKAGFTASLSERLHISYSRSVLRNHVSRFTEPKSISTIINTEHLRGQYIFYQTPNVSLAAEVGWREHTSPTVNFYKYDFKNFQISWPGHVLVSLDAQDSAKLAALRMQYRTGDWSFGYGIEWRNIDVGARMTSESTTVSSALASQAPQAQPWQEKHQIQQLTLAYQLTETWRIAADYQQMNIQRIGYIPRKNKIDYHQNDTLDVYLFWDFEPRLTPYVHAHLSRRSSLGDTPLTYNQRSNHKFEHPFGVLSMGAALKF